MQLLFKETNESISQLKFENKLINETGKSINEFIEQSFVDYQNDKTYYNLNEYTLIKSEDCQCYSLFKRELELI